MGHLFPQLAVRIIAEKKNLTGKEKRLMAMSLKFGCAVNHDDFEEAENIYQTFLTLT